MRYFTFLFFLFACQQSEPKSADPAPVPTDEDILSEVVEEGPVKATIEISPKEIRLGDPIQLKLSVYADKGVDIIPPPFGEALGRFQISNFTPRSVTKDDGSKEIIQTYTLQAPMSGIQRIPALRIVYTDNRNDTATEERELLTEEISLTINGLLEKDVAMDWKPARGTLVPKRNIPLWIRVVSAGGVLVLSFTGLWFYRRRYISHQQAKRVQSAYQKAIGDLMLLTQTDFGSNTDRFYAELSMIVRRYIEAKYGLHAPELTTEEFLLEAKGRNIFTQPHKEFLQAFLGRCDMVKFAQVQPPTEEKEIEVRRVRVFLDETIREEEYA